MISPVMMKGNKAGIRLIISPDATISQVVTCLSDKLQTTGRYYANIKPITVTFEGKDLTEDETANHRYTKRQRHSHRTQTAFHRKA